MEEHALRARSGATASHLSGSGESDKAAGGPGQLLAEARQRTSQSRAEMAKHEAERVQAEALAEEALGKLSLLLAGSREGMRAKAREAVDAAVELKRSAVEAAKRAREAREELEEAKKAAAEAAQQAEGLKVSAAAVQSMSPYKAAAPSNAQPSPSFKPSLISTARSAQLPSPGESPYKPTLSPKSSNCVPQDSADIVEMLALRKGYVSLRKTLKDRIRNEIRPRASELKAEAEQLAWEAEVALHRAHSLVAHSNIEGMPESQADPAEGAAGGSIGGSQSRSGPSTNVQAALRQARAVAACHVLDSELAAAALELRRVRSDARRAVSELFRRRVQSHSGDGESTPPRGGRASNQGLAGAAGDKLQAAGELEAMEVDLQRAVREADDALLRLTGSGGAGADAGAAAVKVAWEARCRAKRCESIKSKSIKFHSN